MKPWAIVSFWCVLTACATTSRFTTREELERVLSSPRPAKLFRDATVDVERWELAGPFPERVGDAPHGTGDAWSRLFVERAQRKGARPVEPLACVARETARFIAAKGGYPGSLLKDFIVARCGNAAPKVALRSLAGDVPDEVSDDDLFARWKADVGKMSEELEPGQLAGFALVREGGKAAAVVASITPRGAVEPLSIFPSERHTVVVRGTAPVGAASVYGYANQGQTKSARCVDSKLPLPAFELTCEVNAADAHAWIDVSSAEKDRLLSSGFVRLLVWPAGAPSNTFERPVYGTPGGELSPAGVLAQVNAVRAQAGMAPLELSAAQSADNHELAPFFFDALFRDDAQQQDRIALGVIAGWRVESEITGGTFVSEWVDVPDLSLLVAHHLESAGARAALLDPEHRVLAVGLYREEGFVGSLLSVYAKATPPTWPDSTEALLLQLDEARKKQGKPEAQWIRLPSELEKRLAEAVAKQESDDEEALGHFMSEAMEVTKRPVHGWRIHVSKLNEVDWPETLLKKEQLEVLGVVTVQRAKGSPWADYLILVVELLAGGDEA
ncbi:MAG: hypothetical protein AB1730_00165 [Myxococcota bacterium]|jgi:hypothetical protein